MKVKSPIGLNFNEFNEFMKNNNYKLKLKKK